VILDGQHCQEQAFNITTLPECRRNITLSEPRSGSERFDLIHCLKGTSAVYAQALGQTTNHQCAPALPVNRPHTKLPRKTPPSIDKKYPTLKVITASILEWVSYGLIENSVHALTADNSHPQLKHPWSPS
jgi:hypothetical protein